MLRYVVAAVALLLWPPLAIAGATSKPDPMHGKDLAEKQLFEKLAPKIAKRLAVKVGQEAAEKWVARIIPLASSAIGGAMNFSFVRGWGRRVQRNLRARYLANRAHAA